MGKVRTVLGDIDSSELGYTMPHEHVFHDQGDLVTAGQKAPEGVFSLWRWDKQLEILEDYKAMGGKTIVDAMCRPGDGRNPAGLVLASMTTGLNIIAATGDAEDFPGTPRDLTVMHKNETIDQIAEHYIDEIENGMDGSCAKAGWIKGSSQYCYISEGAEKCLRAACRAAKETGVPVHTHTEGGSFALEQLEIVLDEGLPASQFCMAHMDRNLDYWVHKKVLETGAYIIYDGPGKVKYYPDSARIEVLKKLIADGFGKQIMLSMDAGKKTHHKVYGYGPGLRYIKERFLPRLLEEGVSQEQIDNFMIHNPARFYSLRK